MGNLAINGFNIASPVLKGAVTGAIGGGAGGYAGGFTSGLITTGDIGQAHQMGMGGLTSGLALGGVAGGVSGYAYAKANGIGPWNGKYEKGVVLGRGMESRINPVAKDLNAETISDDWLNHFGEGQVPESKGLNFNRNWLQNKLDNNYHIYDFGRGQIKNYSSFYQMELSMIQNYPYLHRGGFIYNNTHSNFRIIYWK